MKKVGSFLVVIIILVLVGVLAYSTVNILSWVDDNKKTDELIKEVQEIKPSEIEVGSADNGFDRLKKINNETVGWIEIKGTNVNYPVVKHRDNSYYLTHSFDRSYNDAGWIFLDYRNNLNELLKNTIIYAHGRIDGSMFGSLKFLLNDDYYKNKEHKVYLYTPEKDYVFEVFSFYVIETTNDYLKVDFNSSGDFLDFTNMLKKRSNHNFNVDILENDKIITLSTCYNSHEKLVLHAKLKGEE